MTTGRTGQNGGMAHTPLQATKALEQLRTICFALPEVTERLSHGHPSFFIRETKTLCNFHDNFHEDGRMSMWAPAPDGAQEELVGEEPERFFTPPYVGHRGWIGYWLDEDPDWDEVEGIVIEAYKKVAPRTLVRQLDVD